MSFDAFVSSVVPPWLFTPRHTKLVSSGCWPIVLGNPQSAIVNVMGLVFIWAAAVIGFGFGFQFRFWFRFLSDGIVPNKAEIPSPSGPQGPAI